MGMPAVLYRVSPEVSLPDLVELFAVSWPDGHASDDGDYDRVLGRSLLYVCAYYEKRLIGFVNVAWDGGIHGFILDTTVHPAWRHRGVGTALVGHAAAAAKGRGLEWLHVDFEGHLESFYRRCGFDPTPAGLIRLR
jgi:GNAT superfamily N-acetyltransferase